MKTFRHGIVMALLSSHALAVGLPGNASADAAWVPGLEALFRDDFDAAIDLLKGVAARDPKNAEVHNRLGFAYRKRGRIDLAFVHYREALAISPRHLGAHEYIGEAYLMTGNVAKAREHLATLEKLCGRDCDEYRDLEKAIAAIC